MLYDFNREMPDLELSGIDISDYAIGCSPPEIRKYLQHGNASNLSMFQDNYFEKQVSPNILPQSYHNNHRIRHQKGMYWFGLMCHFRDYQNHLECHLFS